MTKTVKRIIVVAVLLIALAIVGWLVFTGERVASYPSDLSAFSEGIFDGKGDTMVVFEGDKAWYCPREGEVFLMDIVSYEEGVMTMVKDEMRHSFVVINEDMIYEIGAKNVLTRRPIDGT